jgi:hypothetical protein
MATFFHCLNTMLILSGGLVHRHLSETRIAVCPILGPVFVLWFTAAFAEGAAGRVSRGSCADHFLSVRGSASICGVITSTTLEGAEKPEAFHA